MHYGPAAFSRNGLPTIVPKKQALIGQRSGFSETDSYKINTLYECSSYAAVTTSAPLTVYTTIATTKQPSTKRSPMLPPEIIPEVSCKNTRPDCDQLAKQGN